MVQMYDDTGYKQRSKCVNWWFSLVNRRFPADKLEK